MGACGRRSSAFSEATRAARDFARDCRSGRPRLSVPTPCCDHHGVALRIETTLHAEAASGPFLWASHPMLSVLPGLDCRTWGRKLIADDEAPGRFPAGARVSSVPPIPGPGQGWSEVLYASGVAEASVLSPDRKSHTRLAWSADFLKYVWIVTVTGAFGLDLCLLFEPCTTMPYRLAHAIAAGEAAYLVS
jgi:hypothetical protein